MQTNVEIRQHNRQSKNKNPRIALKRTASKYQLKLEKTGYRYLNASTGFLRDALQVWMETVKSAMVTAIPPARAKSHQLRSVL